MPVSTPATSKASLSYGWTAGGFHALRRLDAPPEHKRAECRHTHGYDGEQDADCNLEERRYALSEVEDVGALAEDGESEPGEPDEHEADERAGGAVVPSLGSERPAHKQDGGECPAAEDDRGYSRVDILGGPGVEGVVEVACECQQHRGSYDLPGYYAKRSAAEEERPDT